MTDLRSPTPVNTPLTFSIQCRLSRSASTGKSHRVTINPGWTVMTPHDLAAERIAAAFGGYTSCLELVDRTVPVFRGVLPLLRRDIQPALRRDASGGWRLPLDQQAAGCCRGHRFATVASAVAHARSTAHLAELHGVPRWQLTAVMAGASSVWGRWEGRPPSTDSIGRLVREEGGVAELWRAGIHPRELPALAAAASAVDAPLPSNYFLGMVYADTDPAWLGEVIRARPDPDTAAWLAWLDLPADRGEAALWRGWLRLGVSRADVLFAAEARLPSERIAAIAGVIGWSETTTAKYVIAWAKVDCYLTLEQFQLLARAGVDYVQPARAPIDALEAEAKAQTATPPDRTQLAVMLAVLGTRLGVLASLPRHPGTHDIVESYERRLERSQ